MSVKDPTKERIPADFLLTMIRNGTIGKLPAAELFAGRTVILFGVPGAFTPTCSTSHVPRFNQLANTFKRHSIDEVLCISVNDVYVMSAWKRDQEADNLTFVADGNGDFTRKLGLLVDKTAMGLGQRSWRYSMLVRDGVVAKSFTEPEKPGDPFEVSDADTMLQYIAPGEEGPPDILMLTIPGCGHCERSRIALQRAGMEWVELRASLRALRAVSHQPTAPRVFANGELIGGADDLIDWLEPRTTSKEH